jgi:hypothetical protein
MLWRIAVRGVTNIKTDGSIEIGKNSRHGSASDLGTSLFLDLP